MKKYVFSALLLAGLTFSFSSCSFKNDSNRLEAHPLILNNDEDVEIPEAPYDPTIGIGKYDAKTEFKGMDAAMAAKGKEISDAKCASCHSLTTADHLVGPGWKGVTKKHTAAWLMNYITDPDPMLAKDPELQKQIAEANGIKMPNPGLNAEEVRAVYEYMRQVDGAK